MQWLEGITVCLLVLGPVLIGLYDLFAWHYGGDAATLSFQVSKWCQRYPIIPFLLGWLMCHLLSNLPPPSNATSASGERGIASFSSPLASSSHSDCADSTQSK